MATSADQSTNTTQTNDAFTKFQPQIDKAKAFAKQRPWAVGALAAVVGLATLNTLRGRS